jgi:hypothetical protein
VPHGPDRTVRRESRRRARVAFGTYSPGRTRRGHRRGATTQGGVREVLDRWTTWPIGSRTMGGATDQFEEQP